MASSPFDAKLAVKLYCDGSSTGTGAVLSHLMVLKGLLPLHPGHSQRLNKITFQKTPFPYQHVMSIIIRVHSNFKCSCDNKYIK